MRHRALLLPLFVLIALFVSQTALAASLTADEPKITSGKARQFAVSSRVLITLVGAEELRLSSTWTSHIRISPSQF